MNGSPARPGGSSENKPTCSIPKGGTHTSAFFVFKRPQRVAGCEMTIPVTCILRRFKHMEISYEESNV